MLWPSFVLLLIVSWRICPAGYMCQAVEAVLNHFWGKVVFIYWDLEGYLYAVKIMILTKSASSVFDKLQTI